MEDLAILDFKGCKVLFFVKAPLPGLVKTRLAKDIGFEKAALLYRYFISDIIRILKKTGININIFFYPHENEDIVKNFLGEEYEYIPQEGADLGERMVKAFSYVFDRGTEKAILIGSDTIELSEKDFLKAFLNLKKDSVVIGPSCDGGFYLIGFEKTSFKEDFFKNIHWSNATVLKEIMENIKKHRTIFLLEKKDDIDTIDNLRSLYERREKFPQLMTHAIIEELKIFPHIRVSDA